MNKYHSFNVAVASECGVACALVLGHIDYLVEKAKANGVNKYRGKHWVSKSMKSISEEYPYYTEKQVRHAINILREKKLIETGHFPTKETPSTLWYTVTKKGKKLLTSGSDATPPMANQSDPEGITICPTGQIETPPMANQSDPEGEPSTKVLDTVLDTVLEGCNNSRHHQEDIDINPFGDDNDDDFRPDLNTIEIYASSNLRCLSGGNIERLQSFMSELPEELIRYAIDKACGLGHPFFGYVQPILQQYVELGFRTVADVEAYEEDRKKRRGGNASGEHRGNTPEAPRRLYDGETIV